METNKWLYQYGEIASGNLLVHVDAENNSVLKHAGIRVGDATNGIELPADSNERLILIAAGDEVEVKYSVEDLNIEKISLKGRKDVFHGPADVLYLPFHTSARIQGNARVIIGEGPAKNSKPVQIIRKAKVPVLLRGAGRETRQVHNFGIPGELDADRLICVEVIVPAGNWSGIPAHKHDTYIPGIESNLEEIYYFETKVARGFENFSSQKPFGYFRGYSSDEREFNLDCAVHDGDTVLVPHGYHGPVAAVPGYDLYFFNVMAGPDTNREWNIQDDPNHAWIRKTWEYQVPDNRLPYKE